MQSSRGALFVNAPLRAKAQASHIHRILAHPPCRSDPPVDEEPCEVKVRQDLTCRWQNACPQGPLKIVRFDPAANQIYANTITNDEACRELWYNGSDMRRFRREASATVSKMAHADKRKKTETFSFKATVLGVYDSCCEAHSDSTETAITESQRQCLTMWMNMDSQRWGLERSSIKEIYYDRSSRKRKLVLTILQMQQMATHVTPETKADYLQKASRTVSRPSTLFARLIGQAHASASLDP
jgi:hypothetical protein